MPFAQWHYPFENKEKFEENFPADFISEALDQTRGWFYTLLAISTLLFDRAPFKNCIVLGLVCDKNGQKMSKHKGNVVDPKTVLSKQGADAVRWYFYSASAPWLPSRFYEEAVSESQRKFMGTLWNTYSFYVLYANIDEFDPTKYDLKDCGLSVMDKWILSRLNSLVSYVDDSLDVYHITEAARKITAFTDELSNWYVRRCRERYWVTGLKEDKIAAYMTLYTVLVTLSKVIAPFVPFLADEIYRNLVCSIDKNEPISVHLCDFPTADLSVVNDSLEKNMDAVLKIVTLGRSSRNAANVKNRQPLQTLWVCGGDKLDPGYEELVKDELNVKNVEYTDSAERFAAYSFKPQLRTCGKKFGKLVPLLTESLKAVDGSKAMEELKATGELKVNAGGEVLTLLKEDLLIETVRCEGFVAESEGKVTVVLDINLTPELIEEGFVRELTNKLQTMRKEAGFEVTDRIIAGYKAGERLSSIIEKNKALIAADILADSILPGGYGGYEKEWNINGEDSVLSVKKV